MKNILRGDAVAQAKLYRVVLSGFSAGTRLTAKINNKRITYEAQSSEDAASGMATLINGSAYAEFQEFIASSAENELFLMARTAGRDVFIDFETQGSVSGAITVTRATAGHDQVNEVQKLKLSDGTSGGDFTYTCDYGSGDETTAAIAVGATNSAVKSAFVAAFTDVTTNDLDVVRISDIEWHLYWKGAFAAVEVPEGTIDGTNLTGAGSVQLTRTVIGRGLSNEVQRFALITYSSGDWSIMISADGGSLYSQWNGTGNTATADDFKTFLEGLPTIGVGNVDVFGGYSGSLSSGTNSYGFAVVFKGDLAGVNVPGLLADRTMEGSENISSTQTATLQAGGQSTANEFLVLDLANATDGPAYISFEGDTAAIDSSGDGPFEIQGAFSSLGFTVNVSIISSFSSDGGIYGIELVGSVANTDVAAIGFNGSGLIGTTRTPSLVEARKGGANFNEKWELIVEGIGGTFALGDGTDEYLAIPYNESAANLETGIEANLGEYPGVSVSGTGAPNDPYQVEVTNPSATNVNLLTADGSGLTGGVGTVTELVAHHAGANEVQTITLDPSVAGGTWPATILDVPTGPYWHDEPAAVIEDAFEAAIGAGNVTVGGADGGPYTVTFLNDYADTPVALIEVDGSNLIVGSGSELISVLLDQRSLGPNHANDGANWTLERPPETGDDLILEDGNTDLLYGMNWIREFTVDIANERLTIVDHDFADEQKITVRNSELVPDPPGGLTHGNDYYVIYLDKDHIMLSATRGGSPVDITDAGTGTQTVAVELNSFIDNSRYRALVGLPKRNTTGSVEYYEYRNRKFRFGLLPSGDKKIVIGSGDGDASGRMVLDNGSYEIDMQVFRTGSPVEDGVPALQHTGQNENSLVSVYDGECGFAFYSGESAQYRKIIHTDGVVNFGEGSVAADYVRSGGETLADECQFSGRIKLLG